MYILYSNMKLRFTLAFLLFGLKMMWAQCPPPGFPQSGNTCPQAPILCENLNGYCNTINNNNVVQTFPGCPGYQLNNDEWFAFYAGSTTISIKVTPSNCTSNGNNQGLQAGIYRSCIANSMALQCACKTIPFTLTSNNYVVGQVYWMVIDGCGGDVCDYSIEVTAGSTVGQAPANPDPINGPDQVCQGATNQYNIPAPTGATIYNWVLTPASAGNLTVTNNVVNVAWSNSFTGVAQLCVSTANACYTNPTQSCMDITVNPKPTATISGSGLICANSGGSANLTVTFTGDAPWTFVYKINGANQPAITTSDNPYTLVVNAPGTYTLASVSGGAATCTGTVSGTATVTQPNITANVAVTAATCGQSNGAATLTVSGGTSPYTYNWSGGQTTKDLSMIPAGTYTVTVTDNNGCTKTAEATINDNPITLNLNAVPVANTTCNGGNGSINLTVTPANTYTYLWSGGETTEDLSNLPPGTYTVTVTFGVNCTNSTSVTINDNPNLPNGTGTTTQSTCDQNNASINLTPSGGVAPYTFLWSGGETTEDLSSILAGTYTVTITGNNGCTKTVEFTVNNNNPPFNVTGVVVNNTTCINGNGSINVSIAPPNTYTFEWSNGATTEDLSGLAPGTYTITVTQIGSCTQTADFTINDNPLEPNINPVIVNATCDLPNGSINLTVNGGVPPYSYLWSTGATNSNLSMLVPGDYQVTVTGANGCTRTADITVNNNNPIINISGNTVDNTQCLPNVGNGSITVTVTPPNPNYTYLWNTGATTKNLSALPTGSYTITVSAGGTCTETATFDIQDNPNTPNITGTFVQTTCDLSNGSINITVGGGTTPYTYLWTNGAITQDLSAIPAGDYTVTVTGSNGCTNTAEYSISNNNPPINITALVAQNTTCTGTSNGGINITVFPATPYTYLWSNGATTQDLTGIPAGNYMVTVSGAGSCSETASYDVEDNPNLPNLNVSSTNAKCGLSNGAINLSVNASTTPYVYLWSNGATTQDLSSISSGYFEVTVTGNNGCSSTLDVLIDDDIIPISLNAFVTDQTSCLNNNGKIMLQLSPLNLTVSWSNGSSSNTLSNLAPGDYDVTVSAGGTCTETATYSVIDLTEPPTLTTTNSPALCGLPNGSIDLSVTGSVSPYTYKWSTGAVSEDLVNKSPGTYTVTVTSASGCTATTEVTILNSNISINISGNVTDNNSCAQPNGQITLTVTPTEPYTYKWTGGNATANPGGLAPGTYTVTVTYGTSCSSTATFDVANAATAPNISASGTAATCNLATGSALASAGGGIAPYSYMWTTSGTAAQINNLLPGNYTVTITGANACTATAVAVVSNNNIALNITANISDNTSCTNANGSIDVSVAPAGTYTYAWTGGIGTEDLSNLPAGSYTVTATAGVSCSASATFKVSDNTPNPIISPAITAAICSQSNGGIDLSISNAPAPFAFIWSNSATTEDLTAIPPGNYLVTVTAANGCKADTFLNVANNSTSFTLSGVATPLTNCANPNGAINFTVTPPGAYLIDWSNGAKTEDIGQLSAGVYTVSVTEVGSCVASATFVVDDQRAYPSSTQTISSEICGLGNGSIVLTPADGQAPYTYLWSSGKTTKDLAAASAGNYTVTITDSNACTNTASATIPGNTVGFALSGITAPNTSCVTSNGTLDLTVNPANPGSGLMYSYAWSNNKNTADLTNLAGGTYVVTVSAGGICTNTASFNVPDTSNPPQLSANVAPGYCGQSIGAIDVNTSGSQAPYTYKWSNGKITEDLSALPSGSYTVTATGADGCSSIASFVVPETTVVPSISGGTISQTSCVASNGQININVSPAASYTYTWSNGASAQNLSNLAAGSYTVTVNGGGACISSATYTIDDATQSPTIDAQLTQILCFNNKTGAIDLSVSNGTSPYSYKWLPNGNGSNQDLTNLGPGTYAVTVTDANGCTAKGSYAITQPATALQVVCNAAATVSFPGGSDGVGTVQISGGTAPYTLTPSLGNVQTGLASGTVSLNNLPVGQYTVQITDANGCTIDCGFNIKLVNCTSSVGIMSAAALHLCGPGCLTATYNNTGQVLDANDALQFILHEGSGNTIVNEIARNTQPVFCFDATKMNFGTTYYIAAAVGNKDAGGNVDLSHWCTVISSGTPIRFDKKPDAVLAQPQNINCENPTSAVFCTSGSPAFVYAWTTQNGLILNGANTASALVGAAGTYQLILIDNQCADTAVTQVKDLRNKPKATISADPSDILDCAIQEIVLQGTIEGSLNANAIWISGGQVFANGTIVPISAPGTYQFVVLDTISLCRDTAKIKIDENLGYPALYLNPVGQLSCTNPKLTISGGSAFQGIVYQWIQVNGADTVVLGTGPSLQVSLPGNYYLVGVDPVNKCTNAIPAQVLADFTAPLADAGAGFSLPCYGESGYLDGSASSGAADMTFYWTTSNGSIVSGNKTAQPQVNTPGTYLLLVTNPGNGCTDSDEVVIDPEAPVATLLVKQPPCFGDKGSITITAVQGGKPPVKYSLDNGVHYTNSNYFGNLNAGTYNLLVVDAVGCSTTAQSEIIAAKPFEISLVPQVKIELGDSLILKATVSAPDSLIKTILWQPATGLKCDTCLETTAKPFNSTRYKLKVTSKAGCSDEALIQIIIDKKYDIFVPNIFSPDGDGKNDLFMIFADNKMVKNVKSFQVYSRWGERVFEYYNFMPNNENAAWNGRHNGAEMDPGVFAWYVVVELVDGQEVLLEGDVTLKR